MDDVQIPQLPPEQQLEKELFLRKKQIFISLIEQAQRQGMTQFAGCNEVQFEYLVKSLYTTAPTVMDMTPIDYMIKHGGYVTVFFADEFCKAIWGEQPTQVIEVMLKPGEAPKKLYLPAYKFHKVLMAITDDPFLYLEQFVKPMQPKADWR